MLRLIATLGCVALLPLGLDCNRSCFAQTNESGNVSNNQLESKIGTDEKGLYTIVSPRLTLVSDIPFDDELKSWPGLFEQSLDQWQKYFSVAPEQMVDWKIKAILIGDRDRCAKLGLLDNVPAFDEGYQFGNVIYVREQPTVYYRRLLFLHEATHWIMWKLYGGAGSPWFMEGMAEMQGTHALSNGSLTLGVIPASRDLVAGWGRLRLIDESLKRGVAPTMSEILAFGNAREDHEIRYSWSWAACVFFTKHPKYGPILKDLYRSGKLDYSDALSLRFKKLLTPNWSEVQLEWNAFVSDLDFGYDFSRSAVIGSSSANWNSLQRGQSARMTLATDRGWQPTGIDVEAGKPIRINCSGSFKVKSVLEGSDANWVAEPCGITYRYYRGNPLGCVVASIISDEANESTKRWETIRVGEGTVINSPKAGKLFMKVNEPSNGLLDNIGSLSVEIFLTNP